MTAKSISIKGVGRRFGGCVRKAVVLTSGDLGRVPEDGTEGIERDPDRGSEVSRGRSSRRRRSARPGHSPERGETARGRKTGNDLAKA